MFHNVINHHHVSIALAIIIGAALQEYKEYNNLPHGISGTTQCYNKCLKHWVFEPTLFLLVFYCYPDGDDKSAWCMLVIDNKQWNIFHIYSFVDFIT